MTPLVKEPSQKVLREICASLEAKLEGLLVEIRDQPTTPEQEADISRRLVNLRRRTQRLESTVETHLSRGTHLGRGTHLEQRRETAS